MNKPKFNLVEIILGSTIALLIDFVSIFADLLAGVGGFVIQTLSWLLFTLWFQLKGATATANLVRRFLVPIAAQIIPFVPTQIFTFAASVYMENHPEKFGLVTSAVSLSKMDVKKLKNVKETGGALAAAKEARTMYREAKVETEKQMRYTPNTPRVAPSVEEPTDELEYQKAA